MIACDKHRHFSPGPTCELCDRGEPPFDPGPLNRIVPLRFGPPIGQRVSERLSQIRLRHAEATPGPWRPCPQKSFIFGPNHEMIASSSHGHDGEAMGTVEIRGAGAGLPMDANHDFIVNSWVDVDFLLDVVRGLQEEVILTRRERDARPVLSAEDCAALLPRIEHVISGRATWMDQIRDALRVHAAKARSDASALEDD